MTERGEGPHRTCLGCRQVREQRNLVRFVLSPDRKIVVDYRGRLPGRGAYTCLDVRCLRKAVGNKGFQRAFRRADLLAREGELIEGVRAAVRGKIFNLLGIIRKTGLGAIGSNLVLTKMKGAVLPACLVMAEDAAPGVEKKIGDRARNLSIPVYRIGSREELGRIWGRDSVGVVALMPHTLTSCFEEEMNRFSTISEGN